MINYKAVKQIYNDMSQASHDSKCGRKIFHYTNTEVLDIILKNATLRASHVLYLNDAEEYYQGINIIKDAIGNKCDFGELSESQGIFSISFSQGEDLLSQWITYAKESGVSIEFDDSLMSLEEEEGKPRFVFGIEDDVADNDIKYTHLVFNTSKVLHEIMYVPQNDDKVTSYIKDSYQKTCETDIEGMPLYATYIKDISFEAEKEIRAAFIYHQLIDSLDENADKYCPKLNYYRMDKGILRPFINVRIMQLSNTGRDDSGEYAPMLPLKSITIGPSGNQQAVFDSVVHRIKYGELKVYDYTKDIKRFNDNFRSYLVDVWDWIVQNRDLNISLTDNPKLEENIKSELVALWKQNNQKEGSLIEDVCSIVEPNMNKRLIHIIQEINKNFYFSNKGILIKKSKIPYIF